MKKHLSGVVKSDKMTKSAVVEVVHFKVHPKYLKRIKVNQTFPVDNQIDAKMGNQVIIEETRPISKNKHWKIIKVL